MYRNGVNSFCIVHEQDEPRVTEQFCKVCGTLCEVKRDIYGATCFAQAMCGVKSMHDHFYCPHTEQTWHIMAMKIYSELEKTVSPSLCKMITKDLDDLIAANCSGDINEHKSDSISS